jgi:Activator of Hsp90 ATPase homolog 1-like protein
MAAPDEFVYRRVHRASPQLLFECLTSPEHLTCFWGPAGTRTPLDRIVVDLRPGGAFETVMVNESDGSETTCEPCTRWSTPPTSPRSGNRTQPRRVGDPSRGTDVGTTACRRSNSDAADLGTSVRRPERRTTEAGSPSVMDVSWQRAPLAACAHFRARSWIRRSPSVGCRPVVDAAPTPSRRLRRVLRPPVANRFGPPGAWSRQRCR